MTESSKDALLVSGKMLAGVLQGLSALAGGVVLLLIPVAILISQGLLPGFDDAISIRTSPLSVVIIAALLTVMLAALFRFFDKLRAIIASVGDGDPFTPENASRLSAMAWLFLSVKVLAVLVAGVRFHLANLMDQGPSSGTTLGFSAYDLDGIVIVVVLFILARIFRHGAAMREDLKGTV